MNDAEADRTRQHLPEPTMPWQAPGAHIVDVGGSPGDRVGGAVSVRTLWRFDWACFEVGSNPVALEWQLTHSLFRNELKGQLVFFRPEDDPKKTPKTRAEQVQVLQRQHR